MMAQFESIGKAEAAFRGMIGFVKKAVESGELRIDEVERTLLGALSGGVRCGRGADSCAGLRRFASSRCVQICTHRNFKKSPSKLHIVTIAYPSACRGPVNHPG